MMYYVYAHTTVTGGIFYIGKGVGKRHQSRKDRSKIWHDLVSINGLNSTILADNLTEDEAYSEEIRLIKHFRKFGLLCNKTDGGNGSKGLQHNEEFKAKRSAYMKSELNPMKRVDVRKAVSDRLKNTPHHMRIPENSTKVAGKNNGMYGRKGSKSPVAIPVTIDGVTYESIRIASIELNIEYLKLYRVVRKVK